MNTASPLTLENVKSLGELNTFYLENEASSAEEKIELLRAGMKIVAIRNEREESPEEILSGLEEMVFLPYWRAFK